MRRFRIPRSQRVNSQALRPPRPFPAPLFALPVKTYRVLIAACWRALWGVLPDSACIQTAQTFGNARGRGSAQKTAPMCRVLWGLGLDTLGYPIIFSIPVFQCFSYSPKFRSFKNKTCGSAKHSGRFYYCNPQSFFYDNTLV